MLESDSVASKNCCCHKICLCAWVVILYIVFHVCSLSSSEVNIGCMVLVRNFRCDLRILSDANQFFIEKILEHHGLLGCFSKIYTDPSFVNCRWRKGQDLPLSCLYLVSAWMQSLSFQFVQGKRVHWLNLHIYQIMWWFLNQCSLVIDFMMIEC